MHQLKILNSITSRNSEALDRYLVEIGRLPMVTVDEEIELARKIRKGGPEGDDNSIADMIASGDECRADRQVEHESMADELNTMLRIVLSGREIIILQESFGLGCQEKGLEEIGDQFGLSRERVWQIKEKSINKLRQSNYSQVLRKYIG